MVAVVDLLKSRCYLKYWHGMVWWIVQEWNLISEAFLVPPLITMWLGKITASLSVLFGSLIIVSPGCVGSIFKNSRKRSHKDLAGLFLQMLMNVMETIGANMAARTSWEATGVAALKGISSIISGISVLVSTHFLHSICFSHYKAP